MEKKKLLKIITTTAVAVLPFGLLAVGGYYGVKFVKNKYIDKKDSKENKESNNSDG